MQVWLVSLPVTMTNSTCDVDPDVGFLDYTGLAVFATGFVCEYFCVSVYAVRICGFLDYVGLTYKTYICDKKRRQ